MHFTVSWTWKVSAIKTMNIKPQGLSMETDVLLLANVFEACRNMKTAHIYTAPGLTQQAALKTVFEYCKDEVKCKDFESCLGELRLKILKDKDMLLMF